MPGFEAALQTVCVTVAYFRDEPTDTWRVEGVREAGWGDDELTGALALAAAVGGIEPPALQVGPIEAEGWLARTVESFPEFPIGRRFLIRPTHVPDPVIYGRIVLRLDAGLAFGSGEHASTQGCLMAFERHRASEAAAGARPRHRLGHPGDRRGQAAAPPGAGDGYRALVGPRRRRQCGAERRAAAASRRGWRMAGGTGW